MRGRSSRQEIKEAMEIDKVGEEEKEEAQLSGAYIRSLVKQLTSSRGSKDRSDSGDGNGFSDQSPSKSSEGSGETPPQTGRAQPHKKQVRRRLHTSRPYQERLLNMAEARREIVTALKFHRAAMKQADEQKKQHQHQQQQQQQQQKQLEVQQDRSPSLHVSPPMFEQEARMKSRRNPRIYPSSTDNFIHLDNFYSYYSSFSQHHPLENQYHFPVFPSPADNLNFPLPNQPLGLNLNFHDFNIIDSNHNPSMYSSSSSPSPSSSSSPPLSAVTEEAPSAAISYERGGPSESYGGGGLHHAMDDEEIAEIRSIGEQHQMEWNDTMNLLTSARWLKFLNTMEVEQEVKVEDDAYSQLDQVMEFPEWMNASSESCLQQHFGDYSSDPALPCLEIGEVGGLDGDWLA